MSIDSGDDPIGGDGERAMTGYSSTDATDLRHPATISASEADIIADWRDGGCMCASEVEGNSESTDDESYHSNKPLDCGF